MNRIRIFFLLPILLAASCAPEATAPVAVETAPAAQPAISEEGRAALEAFLQDTVAGGRVPKVVAMAANADEHDLRGRLREAERCRRHRRAARFHFQPRVDDQAQSRRSRR